LWAVAVAAVAAVAADVADVAVAVALFAKSCKEGGGGRQGQTITLRYCVIAHVDLSRLSDSETAATATATEIAIAMTAATSRDDVESVI